jgi:2-keto-4-pentenoate hydratase
MSTGGPYVRRTARPLAQIALTPQQAPATLAAAYAAITATLEGAHIKGWKVGGSNLATCAAFGVDTPYYGALLEDEVIAAGTAVPGFAMVEWKGEVEFALRLNADATGYDAWCIALEMPASPITTLPQAGVNALVADRCGAGALLLGKVHDGPLPDLNGREMVYSVDGVQIDLAGVAALTAHPQVILQQTLALIRDHGLVPQAGQWVATGGVTGCHPLPATARVEIEWDERVCFTATLGDGT